MDRIEELLPGFNCGRCGHRRCSDFGAALVSSETLDRCPFLEQERFAGRKHELMDVLPRVKDEERIVGVIDGEEAQFSLLPLKGEESCREDLFPFDRQAELGIGDVIRYRPLGCPITHFARVMGISNGILTVHIIGPRNLMGDGAFEPRDIGICMVAAFEGVLGRGRMPRVGQTVKFLPHHCMMGKVHSGIVVAIEGSKIRIEGIDLKVWSLGH